VGGGRLDGPSPGQLLAGRAAIGRGTPSIDRAGFTIAGLGDWPFTQALAPYCGSWKLGHLPSCSPGGQIPTYLNPPTL
jgi:hypothetical protein